MQTGQLFAGIWLFILGNTYLGESCPHLSVNRFQSIIALALTLAVIQGDPSQDIRQTDKRPIDAVRSVFVPDKAAAVLGWSPQIRFMDGLRSTYLAEIRTGAAIKRKDADQVQP